MTALAHAISNVPALRLEAFTAIQDKVNDLLAEDPDGAISLTSLAAVLERQRQASMHEVRVWRQRMPDAKDNTIQELRHLNMGLGEALIHLTSCTAFEDPEGCDDVELHGWALKMALQFSEMLEMERK